jgi:prevent-host-death family protein
MVMTMVMKSHPELSVTASEFKAKCLALMDEVAKSGNPVTITKRGKPVAQLTPVRSRPKTIVGAMKGRIEMLGDIMSPIDIRWNAQDE